MDGSILIQQDSLVGRISNNGNLVGHINTSAALTASVAIMDSYDFYDGDYYVHPNFSQQVLQTKDKVMKDDVLVDKIEVSKTPNDGGGYTVYIG